MKKLCMYIIQQHFFKHTSWYLVLLLEPQHVRYRKMNALQVTGYGGLNGNGPIGP